MKVTKKTAFTTVTSALILSTSLAVATNAQAEELDTSTVTAPVTATADTEPTVTTADTTDKTTNTDAPATDVTTVTTTDTEDKGTVKPLAVPSESLSTVVDTTAKDAIEYKEDDSVFSSIDPQLEIKDKFYVKDKTKDLYISLIIPNEADADGKTMYNFYVFGKDYDEANSTVEIKMGDSKSFEPLVNIENFVPDAENRYVIVRIDDGKEVKQYEMVLYAPELSDTPDWDNSETPEDDGYEYLDEDLDSTPDGGTTDLIDDLGDDGMDSPDDTQLYPDDGSSDSDGNSDLGSDIDTDSDSDVDNGTLDVAVDTDTDSDDADTDVSDDASDAEDTLPQTGYEQNNSVMFSGMLALLASILTFGIYRKKQTVK